MTGLKNAIHDIWNKLSSLSSPSVKIGDFEYRAGSLQELFEHQGESLTSFNVEELQQFVDSSETLLDQYKDRPEHHASITADVNYARDLLAFNDEYKDIDFDYSGDELTR